MSCELVPSSDPLTYWSTRCFYPHQLSGRTALLRIDGVTHSIFGQLALSNRSNVTGSFITPTRTIFTLDVGPVEVSVTFLSPIEVRVEVSLFKCIRSLIILEAI